MDGTLYFVAGIVLAVSAVGFSFLGLRSGDFGFSRRSFRLLAGFMAALVLVTGIGAVLNARLEQRHRRIEVREFEQQQKAEQGGGEGTAGGGARPAAQSE